MISISFNTPPQVARDSRLLGGIGRFLWSLIRSPKALLSLLGGGLLRLFKGGFGLLGKGFSGLFKGGKGLLGGLFGGIGKLGKGLFRKIPIIGSLLAIADGIGGLAHIVTGGIARMPYH